MNGIDAKFLQHCIEEMQYAGLFVHEERIIDGNRYFTQWTDPVYMLVFPCCIVGNEV